MKIVTIRNDIIQAARWVARRSRRYRKAEGAFLGAAAAILAVPVAQLDLPSVADWKHALVAGVGGLLVAYGIKPNTPRT